MTTEKIFSIHGKENPKKTSCIKNDDGKTQVSVTSNISYINGLHVITILIGCGLAMSIMTLIPRHNSILEPIYWFEIIFPAGFGIICSTAVLVLEMSILMQRETMISAWLYLKAISAYFLSWLITFCSCYTLWTAILDYNHPMPFVGWICHLPSSIVGMIATAMLVTSGFFEQQELKRKLLFRYQLMRFVDIIVKILLSSIFNQLKTTNAQCIIAVLIPIAKRLTHLVFSKEMKQIVGPENEKANVMLTVSINFSFGLHAAIFLIDARTATMVCMVVVEFLIQLNMIYQVAKLHNKVNVREDEQTRIDKRKAVLKLILAELSEGLIPLAYAIGFSMAYYGPNGHLIGNVKNEYWHFKAVKDASMTFLVMSGLFALDLTCLLLNSSIAWIFCKINLFEEFCIVMEKYWYIMALKMINNIYLHFILLDVNLAYDKTQKFDWITNNDTSTFF